VMTRPIANRFAWLATSCFVPFVILAGPSRAADNPQYTVLPHPSPEELAQGLARWAERFPDAIRVSSCGNSGKGRPVQVCRIADYSMPGDGKQGALFTCAHVATELNGATGLLRLARWLIGDDPRAQNICRNQVVLVVPHTNPDGVAGDGRYRLRRTGTPVRGPAGCQPPVAAAGQLRTGGHLPAALQVSRIADEPAAAWSRGCLSR